ncbi:hypothetical protein ACPCHT_06070 [Nucisporomicrobium flavum]|uniref:hypothetical protein n=1 Tax=Nucisporomicrobium flavum TaxID=2785915 RepID=UPI003C2DAC99
MRTGTVAAWGTLVIGALGQAGLEVLAPGNAPTRAAGVVLVLAVGATLGSSLRGRLRWLTAAVLCGAGAPLWIGHGAAAMRAYGIDAVEAAVLNPVILVSGATLVELLRTDEAAKEP